tara:strand:+ start:128 stop:469 length:342 start_codon:yes stop_codon:yes gene_type:complete
MKSIFKIEEYLPDTNRIVVRFSRLHAPQPIESYSPMVIDCDHLDLYDCDSFVSSLMRNYGDRYVKEYEQNEPIKNETETISGGLNLRDLVGKVIECDTDNYRRELIKMNRVEL